MLKQDSMVEQLYETCYFVESKIVGQQDEQICSWWARKNAFRHAFTAASLVRFVRRAPSEPLNIFNLSGLSCGHQDFSLCRFLREAGIAFRYIAIEHPNSPYLKHPLFNQEVAHHEIEIVFTDLRDSDTNVLARRVGRPDVILFTEIAEHLEHSALLRSFMIASTLLSEHGYVVITTPNMDSWKNRLRHLMGYPAPYWGEGTHNMEAGLFGHIVYYNIPRLRHLLGDCGLQVTFTQTFDYPFCSPDLPALGRLKEQLGFKLRSTGISAGERLWRFPKLMNSMKTLGEVIYLEASKGPRQEIPFAL